MTELSDRDWELINALADGELSDADAARLSERFAAEPALAAALASVRQMSTSLAAMRPEVEAPTEVPPANMPRRPWLWASGGAVAAALLFVAVMVSAPVQPVPEHIHRVYLSQNFEFDTLSDTPRVAGSIVDGFPVLREANLTLVVTNSGGAMASAHYVGRNGCRLTFLRGNGQAPEIPADMQSAEWHLGDRWFQAVASGMDQAKFAAVSEYLLQTTRRQLRQETIVALQGAVRNSTPCA